MSLAHECKPLAHCCVPNDINYGARHSWKHIILHLCYWKGEQTLLLRNQTRKERQAKRDFSLWYKFLPNALLSGALRCNRGLRHWFMEHCDIYSQAEHGRLTACFSPRNNPLCTRGGDRSNSPSTARPQGNICPPSLRSAVLQRCSLKAVGT